MSAVIYYFGRKSVAVFLPLLVTTIFQVTGQGQVIGPRQDENRVLVKTWKTGNAKIVERIFSLNLGEEMREYELDISDQTKRRHFRLQLRRMRYSTIRRPSIDCWWVGLKEVTKDRKAGGIILGPDLLSIEGPGVGDNFPREDWARMLCPIEKPQKVLDGALYGITVERNFLIEKFLVSIQVKNSKYDEAEVKLKSMDLLITLKNQEKKRKRGHL